MGNPAADRVAVAADAELFWRAGLPVFCGPLLHNAGLPLRGGGDDGPVRLCGPLGTDAAGRGQPLSAPAAERRGAGQRRGYRRRGVRGSGVVGHAGRGGVDCRPAGTAPLRAGYVPGDRSRRPAGQADFQRPAGVPFRADGGPAGQSGAPGDADPFPGTQAGLQPRKRGDAGRGDRRAGKPSGKRSAAFGACGAEHHRAGVGAVLRRDGRI